MATMFLQRIKKAAAITAAFVSVLACEKIDTPRRIQEGDSLPPFSVVMNTGKTITDSELSSGNSLIVFFHTECPDCIMELEELQPFYDKYSEELQIVLISRAEEEKEILPFWEQNGYTMPFSAQKDRKIYELFSDSGIPFVVFTVNGKVVRTWDDKTMFNEQEYLSINAKRI